MKNTTIAVSPDTLELVKSLAYRDRVNQSQIVAEALKAYAEKYPLSRDDIERIPVKRGRPPKKPTGFEGLQNSLDI